MKIDRYSDLNIEDKTLRPYQQKAKKDIFEAWDEVDSVMFQMPTGTGKTRLFTSIIHDINENSLRRKEPVKILIIAHRTELIDQIDASLKKYSVAHNVIAGGREKNYKYPVSVASIQTITNARNLEEAKKLKVQFVIIDEAHHALAATYKKLWKIYPNAKFLGVTATPWRMNHQSFKDLFDKLVLSMPIKDFIKQGYLSPYKYFSLKSDSDIQRTIDDIELDKFGEYKEESMEEKMDIGSIRAQLLDSYLQLAEGKKGIIYAINIAHAKHICEEYQNEGYNVVCIDSKTPAAERKQMVSDFRRGKIDIIVNVDIFSEGFDCPDIEFIQLARPTRSLVKYLQQVGRGLRITEDKQHCIILDNVGMYSRFGLPNARRHWMQHFKGKKIDETPSTGRLLLGGGKRRDVDMSEGTEDMELIQEIEEAEIVEDVQETPQTSSAIDDFFPLFGITLGKTTWEEAEAMGYEIEIWKDGPDRTMEAGNIDFWDHDGEGIFTSLYWPAWRSDFTPEWKSKGFSWDLSYDEWVYLFSQLGYRIEFTRMPIQEEYMRRDTLVAEFEALSPDKTLRFSLDFHYGEHGSSTASPKSLYAITAECEDASLEEEDDDQDWDEDEDTNEFDPMPMLEECNFENEYVIFWFLESKKIYDAYIQDDTHFIISELIVDERNQCVHRKRVGKIPVTSWMFGQLENIKTENIKEIRHFGANYTVFHFQMQQPDNSVIDRYFDYKGREIDSPAIVEEKYEVAKKTWKLQDYMDVPVSVATFEIELKRDRIRIVRTCKGVTRAIAIFPILSDFGRRYYRLDKLNDTLNTKLTKKSTLSPKDIQKLENNKEKDWSVYFSDYFTFSVRFTKVDTIYRQKYTLRGELVSGEEEPEIKEVKKATLPKSDTDKLWEAFDKKATSYKYFWFLSVLQLYKETQKDSIAFQDILIRMAAYAWKYVFQYKGEFPQIDQLPEYLKTIKISLRLTDTSDQATIETRARRYYIKLEVYKTLKPLLKNVPYRFLSSWIPFTDNADVAKKSADPNIRCPYSLHDDRIDISPIWRDYLIDHYDALTQVVEKELKSFLKIKE